MNKEPDVLSRNTPALSSTSDMPGTGQTVPVPPTSSNAAAEKAAAEAATKAAADKAAADKAAADKAAADKAAADKAAADKAEAEKKAAEGKDDGGDPPAPEKKDNGINKRFSELTQERKAAEEKAAAEATARQAAEKRADDLAKSLEDLNKKLDKVLPPDPADVRPDKTKFDDPDKYDDALIEWSARQAEKKAKAEAELAFQNKSEADKKAAEEAKANAERERVGKAWTERSAEFTKEHPDFEQVAKNENVQITPTMGTAILYSEKGPHLAYHLGKNPELAAKIAALPPAQQLMQMGVLENTLSQPPKTTTAPDPITPIKGGSTPAPKTPNEESMDEYAARRSAELRAGGGKR